MHLTIKEINNPESIKARTKKKIAKEIKKCKINSEITNQKKLLYKRREVIPMKFINDTLEKLYKDPSIGFTGRDSFYQKVKDKYFGINKQDVINFLYGNKTYQKHKPIKKKIVKPIISSFSNDRWQIDLLDMSKLSRENQGFKYILTCQDHYSKYSWAYSLKRKSGQLISNALEEIISKYKPDIIQSDNAKEFKSKKMKNIADKYEVNLVYSNPYNPQSNGLIERFNQTLKRMIYKAIDSREDNKYIDILDQLIKNYNNTRHSTIKMKPLIAFSRGRTKKNTELIKENAEKMKDKPFDKRIRKGDYVRIKLDAFPEVKRKTLSQNGYTANYTQKIYQVTKITYGRYSVNDIETGRETYKNYARNELLKIPKSTLSNTQIRIRRRRRKRN